VTTAGLTIAIVGLTVISFITRGFFLLPNRELPLPHWLLEALRYAPLAALIAVIAPEIVLTNGTLIDTWRDARLFSVAVASAYFVWRRDILGMIVAGTAVLLVLRIGLGW
jgi:branched-subunit amino acid transport protein